MGASSVTGTGPDDAGITRGPGNGRNQYYSLVDPHIVWHGKVALTEGIGTVYFPSTIVGPPEQFCVIIGGKGYATEKLVGSDGNMTGFSVYGYALEADFIVLDANNTCFTGDFGAYTPEP